MIFVVNNIHVAKTGNDSTGDGSYASPYLTFTKAATVVADFDRVIVRQGTYTEHPDFTGKRIEIIGAGAGETILTYNSSVTLTIDTGTELSHMSCLATGLSGSTNDGILLVSGAKFCNLHDLIISGGNDGVSVNGSTGALLKRCQISGKFDGGDFSNATNLNLEDCDLSTDCTWLSGGQVGAAFRSGATSGSATRCRFTATRNDTTDQVTQGIHSKGQFTFTDCIVEVTVTGSNTGLAVGVDDDVPDIQDGSAEKRQFLNGMIVTVSHEGGSALQQQLRNTLGTCLVSKTNITSVYGNEPIWLPATAAQTATSVSASLAQSSRAIVLSPIDGSEMSVIKGDAYIVAEGTHILLSKQDGETGWPTTVNTINFSCAPDTALLEENSAATSTGVDDVALTSVTNSGGNLALTAAQTAAMVTTLRSGRYNFWFVANSGTYPKTIRAGKLRVILGDTN